MRKYYIIFLCFLSLVLLYSCGTEITKVPDTLSEIIDTTSQEEIVSTSVQTETITESTCAQIPDQMPTGHFSSYASILELYRTMIDSFDTINQNPNEKADELFGLEESLEKDWYLDIFSSVVLFGATRDKWDSGYAIKDLNDDGIDELVLMNSDYMVSAIFSAPDRKPVLLNCFIPRGSCWIDAEGLLHYNGSGGADYSTNAVYRIAVGGASLELTVEFGTDGVEWITDTGAETVYYQLIKGEKVRITEAEYEALEVKYGEYLGCTVGGDATKENSGLSFQLVYTAEEISDIIGRALDAAINNKIWVYQNMFDHCYISECLRPTDRVPLCQLESLLYTYADVDSDGINEIIIDCSDKFILRYYENRVYIYAFTFRNMDRIYTDGSFSWNAMTDNSYEHGESKLVFDGMGCESEEIWHIVNDGEENAEYSLNGEKVSEDELLAYIEDHPKTEVTYSSLDPIWLNKISRADAVLLAQEYWARFEPEKNNYRIVLGYNEKAPSTVYVVLLQWYVIDHWSTFDEIWINTTTGDASIPSWSGGVG